MRRYLEYEKALGRKLRVLREQRGLSQEDLASKVKVHQNQISRLENATYSTSISIIIAVTVELGCHPKDIFDFDVELNFKESFNSTPKPRSTTEILNHLLETDFFQIPRTVASIISECEAVYSVTLKSSPVSGVLADLVEKKILKKRDSKWRNKFEYLK